MHKKPNSEFFTKEEKNMKKLFSIMMVVAVVLTFGIAAYAANTCQVTLTSPAIVKSGCEKVGSVTFSLDAGTTIKGGDWWYMDLPSGTSICTGIDYIIAAGLSLNDLTDSATYPGATVADVTLGAGGITSIPAIAPGGVNGPLSVKDLGGGVATTVVGGGVVLRVYAAANSQRVWLYVYGVGGGAADGYTVGAATNLNINIVDGNAYNANVIMNKATTTAADTVWGNDPADRIGLIAGVATGAVIPFAENTLCVNAVQMSGSLMFTSFASLNDFLTFTGDSQIAHVASANPLSLANCKGDTTGNILIGGQNACSFNYQTAAGYCATATSTFVGNRIFIQGTTTFGDPADKYDVDITSDTPGVYFGAAAGIMGFTPAATNECTAAYVAVPGLAFTNKNEGGTTGVVYPGTSCSVAAANRVRELYTTGGNITGIDTFDALWVNLPIMVYDTSVVGDGIESKITIKLSKYPCGQIFSQQTTIGTFVTTCPVGVGTTLLFPFLPPLDGSIPGWWGGFLIVNGGTSAGTAALTFVEEDGDRATYTTPSIAAGGQWNAGSMASLLSAVTAAAGNSGTFGDSNCSVTAVCNFNLGGGFAFTGNGNEGTGYTAYVLGAAGWQ